MSNQTLLSNPADQKKLLDMLREASNSLTRIESERDLIREMKKRVGEELQLEKKVLNRMVKVYHKQTFQEEVAEHEQFETLYESIVK
jgi:FixJ family two-component response regulator